MIRNTELVTSTPWLRRSREAFINRAAARRSCIHHQPPRSRSLETQMGIKLFSRHRHGIRCTAVADSFLEQIRRVLDGLDLVVVNTSDTKRGHSGRLRIGLYVSPGADIC